MFGFFEDDTFFNNAIKSYVRSSKCNAGSSHYSSSDKCFFHLSNTPIDVVNLQKVQIPSKPSYSNEDYPHRRCTLYPNPPKYLAKNATAIGTVNEETTVVIIIAFAITASAA